MELGIGNVASSCSVVGINNEEVEVEAAECKDLKELFLGVESNDSRKLNNNNQDVLHDLLPNLRRDSSNASNLPYHGSFASSLPIKRF